MTSTAEKPAMGTTMTSLHHDTIVVLDFGSRYTQLIARHMRELLHLSSRFRTIKQSPHCIHTLTVGPTREVRDDPKVRCLHGTFLPPRSVEGSNHVEVERAIMDG